MCDKMSMYGMIVIFLGIVNHVTSVSLTLDEDARQQCKKYKMMCKIDELCAIQRFTEPRITMPVCIPTSYVPVRNLVCRLPAEKGTCNARYIRWHFNIHLQSCAHFQYGGCGGNDNNFMTREECESACLRTPTIRLIDGGSVKPAIMTAPEYKPPAMNKYEALNSVMMSSPEYEGGFERFQMMKQRHNNRNKSHSEVSTRKRRRLIEKERAAKEKRRRERRKERRRLRKLKKRKRRKEKKRGLKKRKKSGKKNKKRKSEISPVVENEKSQQSAPEKEDAAVAKLEHDAEIVEEAEEIVNREIQELEDEEEAERIKKEKRKERKRKKRRQRRKKRRLDRGKKAKKPKYAELRGSPESTLFKRFQILDRDDSAPQANSLVRTS